MKRLAKDSVVAAPDNEVSEYLQMYEIPIKSDPLIWWNEKKDKFPILSNLAQKYLAVLAILTASERLFSDARNLLTNKNMYETKIIQKNHVSKKKCFNALILKQFIFFFMIIFIFLKS